MPNGGETVWLVSGVRTPFVNVDGPFAKRDSLTLSVPVVQAMAQQVNGRIDFGVWGSVVVNLAYANLAREVWLEAKLDPHVPTFTTIMQCSTSMVGVFEAAGMLDGRRASLAMVGGVESMTRAQFGLSEGLSVWLRRLVQARSAGDRLHVLGQFHPSDVRLHVPKVQNRVTRRSMGEHTRGHGKVLTEDRPQEQDELTLEGHQRAVAAQDRGFFKDLVSISRRRRQGSLSPPRHVAGEARAAEAGVRPHQRTRDAHRRQQFAVDRRRRRDLGRDRGRPVAFAGAAARARLVDFEMAAVDIIHEGLLMAPVTAIPRLLARHGLKYDDIVRCGKSMKLLRRRCCAISRGLSTRISSAPKPASRMPSAIFRASA